MEGDRYAVKWDLHRDIIMENLERMYSLNSLTDCILIAGDREIHAHKVILSSCSSYFKKLFERTTDKVPLIVFNGITYEELRSIIEYMYRGEVTVDERSTSRILTIGKDLKIEGLVHDPKYTKEKQPANFSWENQPGYSHGTFQHPDPQNPQYAQSNTGWNYHYPQSAQYNGFNGNYGNYDQPMNFTHAPVNVNGNGARPAGQVGSIGNSQELENAETPSQALSRQIMNLITPQEKREAPKRKKDECFKSPTTTRKKSGKVHSKLSSETDTTPETDGSDKNLENTTQNEENKEVTQASSDLSANEGNDGTDLFNFPMMPTENTLTPLNLTYVATPLSSESIDITDIGIPLSYQENTSESYSDQEAPDSGFAGTQEDPIQEETRKDSMDDESAGLKDMIQDTPTQKVFGNSLNKGTGKKSTSEVSDQDESNSSTGGGEKKHVCFCGRRFTRQSDFRYHQKKQCGVMFQCVICQKSFKSKNSMKTHMMMLHGVKD